MHLLNYTFSFLSESSGGVATTDNAFIFSLRNKEGLGPFKSMVAGQSKAIYRSSYHGPTFARSGYYYYIYIAHNANNNINSYAKLGGPYPAPSGAQDPDTILAGTKHYTPDDWEVFYLATKGA